MRVASVAVVLLGVAAAFILVLKRTHQPSAASMKHIAEGNIPAFVRTDFSDDAAWEAIRADALQYPAELREAFDLMVAMNAGSGHDIVGKTDPPPCVEVIADREYADMTAEELLKLLPPNSNHACLFIVDRRTILQPDHAVLVVDLSHERGRTFRAIPSEVWGIADNLSIANMDWEDFAEHLNQDGVFRGFAR